MMSMTSSNIAILKIKNVDYVFIITEISKCQVIDLAQNIVSTERVEHYKKFLKINIKSNF